MRVPEELKRMLGHLDCNQEYLIHRPDVLVFLALLDSSPAQRQVVRAFLDKLFSSNPSYEELHKVWFSGPIEIGYQDEAYLRNFFRLMREQLDKSL